jgi:hypothetical protein
VQSAASLELVIGASGVRESLQRPCANRSYRPCALDVDVEFTST